MTAPNLEPEVDKNKFNDLSGIDITKYENSYDALIEACNHNTAQIQSRYATHRIARNGQQKARFLAPEFEGLYVDPILRRLEDPTIEPGFRDERNSLVFWARPTQGVRDVVGELQRALRVVAPDLWLMPLQNLHLTALELCHSRTPAETDLIVSALGSETYTTMANYTLNHRPRLIKPMLSYDTSAIALSFLPASGEALPTGRTQKDDDYTYHHLRRDLFSLARKVGVSVDSRYVVPSSHITIARFLSQGDHDTPEKRARWIEKIEELNGWLEREFWPREERGRDGGEWIVGMGKGLDFRGGSLWYGGGESICVGEGFEASE